MTDPDLRDLFHAAAPSLEGPDPAAIDRAWRDGSRRRVGTRAAVVASIAATAAAVTGVAVLDPGSPQSTPSGPSTSSPTSTPSSTETGPPVAEPSGKYAGAPVWLAPSVMEEVSLPPVPAAPLSPVIDLDEAQGGDVGEPVLALFSGRGERAFALTASQRVVEIDTSRLKPVADEAGNGRNPLSFYSLSAEGTSAFFIQKSSLEVLDFETGEWTSIDTPDWLAEGARWLTPDGILVPDALGNASNGTIHQLAGGTTTAVVDFVHAWTGPNDEAWGPVAAGRSGTAQAAFLAGPVYGASITNPQAVMVSRAGERSVLALDYGHTGEGGTRVKGCCIALGWLDEDTVLFSSTGTAGQRILGWDVGTPNVYLVSEIRGPGSITALGDLS